MELSEERRTFREETSNENNVSSYSPLLLMQCEKLLSLVRNRTAVFNDQQLLPNYIRQLLAKQNLTLRLPKTIPECARELTRLASNTNEYPSSISHAQQTYAIQEHSRSLIVFVILIAVVSLISILGNLSLAKVLYSKRCRLVQTDRIVLCLALSELCLVLIDTPTEIYRFLSYSFTLEWLCRFHTFFEALFSACIIFYHLLGAFDRFVFMHGHVSSNLSRWSDQISSPSASIVLLVLPIVCSVPIAICNCLHANIIHISSINRICIVQYTHGLLIGLLLAFYILPLFAAFFLHGKLIYFIRRRHHPMYLTKTAYLSSMHRPNRLQVTFPHQRVVMINPELLALQRGSSSTTTTSMALPHALLSKARLSPSSNSSLSSRSSTTTHPHPSSIILYKINSQANANANRTVLLLVLLLSFYVFCWAPYNIYTWHHAYRLTPGSPTAVPRVNRSSVLTTTVSPWNDLQADLRRIIFLNYSLYLLSMVSMCFSFLFYFSLNKQAREEFSRLLGCLCPKIRLFKGDDPRTPFRCHQRSYGEPHPPRPSARVKLPSSSSLPRDQRGKSTRRLRNYEFQIQCCS